MSCPTRDGTGEPVSRDQVFRCERRHGFLSSSSSCSPYYEQDRQPYPVDLYSAIRDDHTFIHSCLPPRVRRRRASSPVVLKVLVVIVTSAAYLVY